MTKDTRMPTCDICAGEGLYVDLLAGVLRPCPRCNPRAATAREQGTHDVPQTTGGKQGKR